MFDCNPFDVSSRFFSFRPRSIVDRVRHRLTFFDNHFRLKFVCILRGFYFLDNRSRTHARVSGSNPSYKIDPCVIHVTGQFIG